jgi:hypothetical protein
LPRPILQVFKKEKEELGQLGDQLRNENIDLLMQAREA